MGTDDRVEQGLRELLVAYEHLDAAWRRQFDLNANEKLAIIFLGDGISAPSKLAEAIGITTAGMTTLLDRLEQRGLLRREAHPDDGRRVLVTLTKAALRARLEFERVTATMASEAATGDDATIGAFLERAAAVATAHARPHEPGTEHG
ncbi:MAG: MarR family transcriptional regulator [Thermoleophilia bacterium]|nr:MarR family transcriptional regulator [Thermoleophilia bacterium]